MTLFLGQQVKRFLVCGDLHLKPAASDYDLDAMAVPDDIDAALILGDLTHRAGPDDIALARRFVERLEPHVPVVYVPGNHDPASTEERIVESLSGAYSGHRTAHDFDGVTVVGWGCERRTLSSAIDQCEFEALDPRNVHQDERRYAADQAATAIEEACYDVVCGESAPEEGAASLGIEKSERAAFYRGIEVLEARYDLLAGMLEDRANVLLATHLPPFNTSFDRHHAVGTREIDQEFLHVGSIAIKLAIREHDVFAALSRHSHAYGYDSGQGDDGRPCLLNLGYRGIGTVTIEPTRGVFTFTRETTKGT